MAKSKKTYVAPMVLRLERRLPNLNEDEQRIFTEAILEAYHKGRTDHQGALEDELAAALDYIGKMKDCETCLHEPDPTEGCAAAAYICQDCLNESCTCKLCMSGSKWEWRHGHGKD